MSPTERFRFGDELGILKYDLYAATHLPSIAKDVLAVEQTQPRAGCTGRNTDIAVVDLLESLSPTKPNDSWARMRKLTPSTTRRVSDLLNNPRQDTGKYVQKGALLHYLSGRTSRSFARDLAHHERHLSRRYFPRLSSHAREVLRGHRTAVCRRCRSLFSTA